MSPGVILFVAVVLLVPLCRLYASAADLSRSGNLKERRFYDLVSSACAAGIFVLAVLGIAAIMSLAGVLPSDPPGDVGLF